jgi:hypothetical protein
MADLAQFMEDALTDRALRLLERRPAPRISQSGGASSRIARSIRDADRADQVLATVFWWCYVRTPAFATDMRTHAPSVRLSADRWSEGPDLRSGTQLVVVRHGEVPQYDLLVLGPPGTQTAAFSPGDSDIRRALVPNLQRVAERNSELLQRRLALAGIDVDTDTVGRSVTEMAAGWPFYVAVGTQPRMMDTARAVKPFIAPGPALSVTVPREPEVLATAGLIGRDDEGHVFALTARHALAYATHTSMVPGVLRDADPAPAAFGGHPQCRVGEWAAWVRSLDEVTDSCVLQVMCTARAWPEAGLAGVRQIAPVEHRPATFDGAASQHRETMIRGYDLSILDPDPFLASKVYTDADTVPGDSGAALVDSEDYIVGFAVSRTAFGAPLEFSSWAWADQVLARHGLTYGE